MQKFRNSVLYSLTALILVSSALLLLTGANESRSYKPLTQNTFIDIAKELQPAVVSISVSGVDENQREKYREFHERLPNDPFYRFFTPNPNQLPQDFEDNDELFRFRQAGSGVIIRQDGYILTNRHVIQNAEAGELTIALKGGQEFAGADVQIVGMDELTDLAVLKVKGDSLPTAKLGNSDELQIGQWVLAIGDPLELRNSVTEGIISGLGRDIQSAVIRDFIQTTAVINPGNSGGPLVNLDSEVIGINVLIPTNTGRWQGVAFAIPSNIARKVSDDLVEHGKVRRGYVGVSMRPLVPEIKEFVKYEGEGGVWVYGLTNAGPAQRAGMLVDDIVAEIDGEPIANTRDMLRAVAEKPVGTNVKIKIFRKGEYHELSVPVDERPSDETLALFRRNLQTEHPAQEPAAAGQQNLGIEVAESPSKQLDAPDNTVLEVTRVKPDSPAAQAGIQQGDMIYEVNGRRVRSLDEMREALKEREQDTLIKLFRGERDEFVIVNFGAKAQPAQPVQPTQPAEK